MTRLEKLLADKAAAQKTIVELNRSIQRDIDVQVAVINEIDQQIDEIISLPVSQARLQQGKDTGTINLIIDGVTIRHDMSKTVRWDQSKIIEIRQRIASFGDNPDAYMKAEYSIEEKRFAMFPKGIQDAFMPAREVRPGKPKVTFIQEDN